VFVFALFIYSDWDFTNRWEFMKQMTIATRRGLWHREVTR